MCCRTGRLGCTVVVYMVWLDWKAGVYFICERGVVGLAVVYMVWSDWQGGVYCSCERGVVGLAG